MESRIAIAFIFAFCAAHAGASKTDAAPPATCTGRKLTPDVDRDSLTVDEAICAGKWRFGINHSGIFGLWHGDKLIKKYSHPAFKLKLHEEHNGEEAHISVYKKKGEQNPIWELKCENLSGNGQTKLMIHDGERKSNVIRLKQGSGAQDKLWLFNKNKKEDKLEVGQSQNCKIDKHPPISGEHKMIVLDGTKTVCIGVNFNSDLKQGHSLVLVRCDVYEESQRFILDSKGRIHPLLNDKLCVDSFETEKGEELFLNDCKTPINNVWEYDQNGAKTEIKPSRDTDFCVTCDDDVHLGASVMLDGCAETTQTAWDFVYAADYQDPSDQMGIFETSRQFLRKMAEIVTPQKS